jgi:hypothetical protein
MFIIFLTDSVSILSCYYSWDYMMIEVEEFVVEFLDSNKDPNPYLRFITIIILLVTQNPTLA